jgi:hypothetical protein
MCLVPSGISLLGLLLLGVGDLLALAAHAITGFASVLLWLRLDLGHVVLHMSCLHRERIGLWDAAIQRVGFLEWIYGGKRWWAEQVSALLRRQRWDGGVVRCTIGGNK